MKRATYRDAVEWIALNDEPVETDLAVIANMISVQLVADLFLKPSADVAADVANYRLNQNAKVQTT